MYNPVEGLVMYILSRFAQKLTAMELMMADRAYSCVFYNKILMLIS